jgi:hypothetical protein
VMAGARPSSLSRDDHWRARCWETGTAGSGRGPLEKDLLTGTSAAAYRYCIDVNRINRVQSIWRSSWERLISAQAAPRCRPGSSIS